MYIYFNIYLYSIPLDAKSFRGVVPSRGIASFLFREKRVKITYTYY